MEFSHSLSSASTYLNNLLLARGLLPNGKSIDFASLDTSTATSDAPRVINLIHDLILRRDRDTSQRESLATTIRTLRAEESQHLLNFQKIQTKNSDLKRDLAVIEASERSQKATIKKLETSLREHKEQTAKLKSVVDQGRAKCISDVRKRDLELEKLKSHVAGLQRGNRKGDGTGMRVNTVNLRLVGNGNSGVAGQDVNSHEWKLENETNDFLAAIVNETSTENVSLRKIVEDTMQTLKDLIGLDGDEKCATEEDVEYQDGIGVPGQYRSSRRKNVDIPQALDLPNGSTEDAIVSCDTLEVSMNQILDQCRLILKDPSFVPIEEVQIRDEEIIKLRIGWEKMASRWKEAVTMMDTWRRKMVDGTGETMDVNEISQLAFGRSVAVLPNGQPVLGEDEELSSILFDQSRMTADHDMELGDEDDQSEAEAEAVEEVQEQVVEEEESDLEIPSEPPLKRLASSPARRGFTIKRPTQPLEEMNTNITRSRQITAPTTQNSASSSKSADSGIGSLGSSNSNTEEEEDFDTGPSSRLTRGSNQRISKVPLKFDDSSISKPRSKYIQSTREDTPRLTIAEKLAAVEAEAREARENNDTMSLKHGETSSISRKRKIQTKSTGSRKVGGRRRSTLSPEELATLMGAA